VQSGQPGDEARIQNVTRVRTLKLTLAYDGTDYAGWQRQQNALAVQQVVEEAFAHFTGGEPPTVSGAGRTDSGVHALGQVASVNVEFEHSASAVMRALNVRLPDAIRLIGAAPIPAHFPPFAGTDAYRACTAGRTASMMRNVRRMQRTLRATPLGAALTSYQHGLYFTLSPRGTLRIRDTRRAVNALAEALSAEGLPVRHAGSFGFDFVAVEWFTDPVTHRNVIRVAPGDIPPSVALRVADGLVRWFARQGHGEAEPPADDQELAGP